MDKNRTRLIIFIDSLATSKTYGEVKSLLQVTFKFQRFLLINLCNIFIILHPFSPSPQKVKMKVEM